MSGTEDASFGGLADIPENMRTEIAEFLSKSSRPAPDGAALAEELGESLALKEILSAPVRS